MNSMKSNVESDLFSTFMNSHSDYNCFNMIRRNTIQWNPMLSQRFWQSLVFKFQLNGAAWVSPIKGSQEIHYNKIKCQSLLNFRLNGARPSLGFMNSHCRYNCSNRITRNTIQWSTMLSQSCFEVSTQQSRAKETTPAWVSSRYKDTKEYLALWVTAIIVNRARQKKTTQA